MFGVGKPKSLYERVLFLISILFLLPTTIALGMWVATAETLVLLGGGFAAISVWLGARIVNRREKWAIRTGVAIFTAIAILYPLSCGPAAMLHDKLGRPYWTHKTINTVYRPLVWAVENGPKWYRDQFNAYIEWWAPLKPQVR